MSATTPWYEFDSELAGHPELGERCLWAITIHGKLAYFLGRLINVGDVFLVQRRGVVAYPVQEVSPVYWARIIPVKEESCHR